MWPIGRGGRPAAVRRQRRVLAARHAIDAVVDDDGREVHVAPRRVDEVVAADGRAVAVAHGHQHLQAGVGHLDAGGGGQRPAVGAVVPVKVQIVVEIARAADAGGDHHVVLRDAQVLHRPDHGADHRADAAPGTPDGGQAAAANVLVNKLPVGERFAGQWVPPNARPYYSAWTPKVKARQGSVTTRTRRREAARSRQGRRPFPQARGLREVRARQRSCGHTLASCTGVAAEQKP